MKELLEACHKFIAQISPSGDERYYDIDPQDLKEFCDSVEAAQHQRAADSCPACEGWKRYYDGDDNVEPCRVCHKIGQGG